MKWLTDFSIARPWLTLFFLLLATIGMATGLKNIEIDPDVLRDLPNSMPEKQLYDRMGEIFPSKEMVFIGVEHQDLWTPDALKQLAHLTEAIEDVSVVQQVMSPTNATVVQGTVGAMVIRDAMEDLPTTPQEAEELRDFLLTQDSMRGTVISEDGEVVTLMVFLTANLEMTESNAAGLINEAMEAEKGDLVVYPAGRPMMTYFSSKTIGKETGMLTSAALVLMTILLGVLFRNFRGIVLPLGVVIASVLWTMGGMAWIGLAMTHSTEALPIMLIAIGVADGVHILQAYMTRVTQHEDKLAAVRHTMEDLRNPIIMTSVTTAIGFLALNTSGVRSIMILGALVAFGTMVALIFSMSFMPAMLALMPVPKRARQAQIREKGFPLQRLMRAWGDLLVSQKVAATGFILATVALSIYGATKVEVETSLLENLTEDHPQAVSARFINDHFAGVTSVQVIFDGGAANALKDPAFLRRIEAFETYAESIDGVGGTSSLLPMLTSMNQVLHAGDPDYKRLPNDKEVEHGFKYEFDEAGNEVETPTQKEVSGKQVLEGYFSLFEMQGRAGDLSNFMSEDYSSAKVTVFLKSDRKQVMDRIVGDLRAYMDENLRGETVEMTGMAVLMLAVNDLITVGQGMSIAVSLLLVFGVTSLMFRSPVLGLFNVIPLFVALFFNFGVMGLAGLNLNLMTMGVASMAIGVGVDFAIHFVHRYRAAFAQVGEPVEALRLTMEEAGVAIVMNMIAVAGGFLPLLLASFKGVMAMGLLISLIMAFSAFGALSILPILFVVLRPRAAESSYKAAATVLLATMLLGLGGNAYAEPGDGRAFMDKVYNRTDYSSMVGKTTLTLTSARGTDKVRVFKMASRDNDEDETDLIMRMEEPADMRGNGFLIRGRKGDDDRYIYVPALGRSNRIVGSGRGGSFMSSEFSYEDIGMPDIEEWVWTLAGETEVDGHLCAVIEAKPRDKTIEKDTGYSKVVHYVDKEILTTRKSAFFDKQGLEFKVMVVTAFTDLDGTPFATDMTMTDTASGRKSRLVMSDLVVNSEVDATWFSNRALQNGF